MIDIKTLPTQGTRSAASDAHADVQAAIDILHSLVISGKLGYDAFDNVRYFLVSAQYEMENLMEGGAVQVE